MKLKNVYKEQNGNVVGFLVEDGIAYCISPKLLYSEMIIRQMVEAGYEYHDYNYEHITYHGESIVDLPALLPDTNTNLEILMNNKNGKHRILSDAEASKYYTFTGNADTPVIEFSTMKEYLINTREELERYVKEQEAKASIDVNTPVLPLNMIVNPEIYFTPNEILAGNALYARAIRLRKFNSFNQYKKSCDILADLGFMSPNDTSARSFLQAWYAFGPDLIKGDVTKYKFSYDVDGEFQNGDRLPVEIKGERGEDGYSSNSQNRIFKPGIFDTRTGEVVDSEGNRYSTGGVVSFDMGERKPIYLTQSIFTKVRMGKGFEQYRVIPSVGYTDCTDRIYFTVKDGSYDVEVKIDLYRIRVSFGQQAAPFDVPFTIASMFADLCYNIEFVDSEEKYNKVLLSQFHAIAKSKDLTIDPIFRSNADYLQTMGMNPISITKRYITEFRKDPGMYTELNPAWREQDDLICAIELYVKPIPDYIRDAFELPATIVTKSQFLDYVDPSAYALKLQMSQDISSQDESAPSFVPTTMNSSQATSYVYSLVREGIEHEPLNYYTFINFIDGILNGTESYGALFEGISEDAKINIEGCSAILRAVAHAVNPTANIEEFSRILADIDTYVNVNTIYRRRTSAAVGCIRDLAEDARRRYSDDVYAFTYVTKVFRELSNKPATEQRPYMLELFAFCNRNKAELKCRRDFRELVSNALQDIEVVPGDLSYDIPFERYANTVATKAQLSQDFAGMAGAELLFRCFIGVHSGKIPVDRDYAHTLRIGAGVNVTCIIPAGLLQEVKAMNPANLRKYVTLYEYTELEVTMFEKDEAVSQFTCINADIDPWNVNPKPGFSIKSYPLMVNYFNPKILGQNVGTALTSKYIADGVKVVEDLVFNKGVTPLIPDTDYSMSDAIVPVAERYEDLNCLLDLSSSESTRAYIKRWNLLRKKAKDEGKVLLTMPLKQDVLYPEFGMTLGYEIETEPTYTSDATRSSAYRDDTDVLVLRNSGVSNAITENSTGVGHPLMLKNISSEMLLKFGEVLNTNAPVINLSSISTTLNGEPVGLEFMQKYGVQVSENTWMARALNGIVVLEV